MDTFINILTRYSNNISLKDLIKILVEEILPEKCYKSKDTATTTATKIRNIIENKLPDKNECDKVPLNDKKITKKQTIQKQIGPDDIVREIILFFNDNVKYLMNDPNKFQLSSDVKITNTETIYDQLKNIFNDFSDDYIEGIKHISNTLPVIFKEKECKINYIKDICNIRTKETNMINNSLKDIRDIIRNILLEKNKTSMDASPEFIDACLPSYCDDSSCFTYKDPLISKSSSIKNINSIVFNTIKNELAQTECNEYKCLNIIISVFCVVNLEKLTNNPPLTPYIDINDLRYGLNHLTKNTFNDNSSFINNCNDLITKMENVYNDKITELLKNETFKNFKTVISSKLYKNENKLNDVIQTILLLFNEIDKFNASSTIGTLQFVDTLSKYNTVDIMCANSSDLTYQPIQKVIKRYNFTDIVS